MARGLLRVGVLMCLYQEVAIGFDSQAFQASPDQMNRVWNIPNCEDVTAESLEPGGQFHGQVSVPWGDFRMRIVNETQYPHNLEIIMNDIFASLLGEAMEAGSTEMMQEILMRESYACLFGVAASLYYYTQYVLQFEEDLDGAFLYHSLFDVFFAGSHPELLDKADWGFSSRDVTVLKHVLLKRKFERGLKKREEATEEQRKNSILEISGGRKQWFLDNNLEHVFLSGGGNTRRTASSLVEDDGDEENQLRLAQLNLEKEKEQPYFELHKNENPADWSLRTKKQAIWLVRESDKMKEGIIRQNNQLIENNYLKGQAAVRIYVYDVLKVPTLFNHLAQASSFCGRGQWAAEVHFHEWLLQSQYRVLDPYDADYFFVPGYAICIFEGGFLKLPEIDMAYRQLVENELWYFKGRERQHIFTFASGMGINVFFSWKEVFPESIFLTPETSLYNDFPHIVVAPFSTFKDIAIPGYLHRNEISSLTRVARPVNEKSYTVVFFGRVDPSRGVHPALGGKDVRNEIVKVLQRGKKIRDADDGVGRSSDAETNRETEDEQFKSKILEEMEGSEDSQSDESSRGAVLDVDPSNASDESNSISNKVAEFVEFAKENDLEGFSEKVQTYSDVFVGYTNLDNMHNLMGDSKFCFIPRGKSAWSLRLYEAFFADCIPVLLSDFWELPFEEFIDYSEIIIRWPMNKV